jgi:acyl-CoA synthetase (NDP forming)
MTDDDAIRAILSPGSVAIVGASDDPDRIGGRPIRYMHRFGFRGRILPVNPRRPSIQGLQAWGRLDDLPVVPDLAIVAVAGDDAMRAVDDCARLGVRAAVVIASGFGETGAHGKAQQDAMVARARASGLRIVGPNTQGVANFGNGAIANFSTLFGEIPPEDGPVAIVSQSGAISQSVYGLVRNRGLGIGHVHATGNEADLTVADFAHALAQDPKVGLILLYLESISDPETLARAAAIARERDLPMVALKAARSPRGQRSAASHTGALADEDRVVDAFLRQHGIWRVDDVHGLARCATAYVKGWRPTGRRLVMISNSGASCVLGADRAHVLGMPLATLSESTRAQVAATLPGFASSSNPIDITAALLSNSRLFSEVLPPLARDPAADLFCIALPVAGAGYDVTAFARDTARFAADSGRPVIVAAWQSAVADVFARHGVVVQADESDALEVLDQLYGHTAAMRRRRAPWPVPQTGPVPARVESLRTDRESRFADEAASLRLLRECGLPVVAHRLCPTLEQACAAWTEFGTPVAVKACSARLPHKSDHGLVALGLDDASAIGRAFDAHRETLARLGIPFDGVLVARMARGLREFMVGARQDARFGTVVLVGDGGRHIEAMPDFATLVAPFDDEDVRVALRGLRVGALLDGVRGEPPLDVDALVEVVLGVGRLVHAARGAIASVDLNPVRVGAAGEGVTIVDALVEFPETPTPGDEAGGVAR